MYITPGEIAHQSRKLAPNCIHGNCKAFMIGLRSNQIKYHFDLSHIIPIYQILYQGFKIFQPYYPSYTPMLTQARDIVRGHKVNIFQW